MEKSMGVLNAIPARPYRCFIRTIFLLRRVNIFFLATFFIAFFFWRIFLLIQLLSPFDR